MSENKSGPPIDLKKHGAEVRKLMQSWRFSQGNRAAGGIPEVMRALEFIAEPIANQQAWAAQPNPVILTRKQVRLAQHRAISMQRRVEHGRPEDYTPETWFEQIHAIAARWKIETVKADWERTKPEAKAA